MTLKITELNSNSPVSCDQQQQISGAGYRRGRGGLCRCGSYGIHYQYSESVWIENGDTRAFLWDRYAKEDLDLKIIGNDIVFYAAWGSPYYRTGRNITNEVGFIAI